MHLAVVGEAHLDARDRAARRCRGCTRNGVPGHRARSTPTCRRSPRAARPAPRKNCRISTGIGAAAGDRDSQRRRARAAARTGRSDVGVDLRRTRRRARPAASSPRARARDDLAADLERLRRTRSALRRDRRRAPRCTAAVDLLARARHAEEDLRPRLARGSARAGRMSGQVVTSYAERDTAVVRGRCARRCAPSAGTRRAASPSASTPSAARRLSTVQQMLAWSSITPFGGPVVPDV